MESSPILERLLKILTPTILTSGILTVLLFLILLPSGRSNPTLELPSIVLFSITFYGGIITGIIYLVLRKRQRKAQAQRDEQLQQQAKAAQDQLAIVEDLEREWQHLIAPLPYLTAAITAQYKAVLRDACAAYDAQPGSEYQEGQALKSYFTSHIIPVVQAAYSQANFPLLGIAHWPKSQPVPLPTALRFHHAYIIGATGTGKTMLLKQLILNDIGTGAGVTVLTPDKSFFTEHLLPCMDTNRANDLMYFNPEDGEQPVTFNPLTLAPNDTIDRKADELLTLFKRAIGETSPRMDAILRNSFYALLERTGSTLNDMYDLLNPTKPTLRQAIISQTKDERTREFFRDEFPTYPKDAARPILNRLDALTRASFLKNALCQPESSLTFTEAMNHHRLIFCNLSDGALGTQNATLLGQLLIAAIQQALFSRDSQPEAQRVPHYLYIDEFETYTTASTTALTEILTRARKLKLGITMAHQNLKQLPPDLLAGILGNVAIKIAFRLSYDDAVKLTPHLDPDDTEGIIKHIITLPVGHAFARVGDNSFAFTTIPDTPPRHANLVPALIAASRQNFGRAPQEAARRTPTPELIPDATPDQPVPTSAPQKPKKPDDFLE